MCLCVLLHFFLSQFLCSPIFFLYENMLCNVMCVFVSPRTVGNINMNDNDNNGNIVRLIDEHGALCALVSLQVSALQ